jgi:SAM-dependent methyltransferase
MNKVLDVNQIFDAVKLRFYYEWIVNNHVYDEGESGFHKELTTRVVTSYVDPLNMPKDAHILDLGCGPGYFLDEMKERGYTNLTGITLSDNDIKLCESKGHVIKQYDLSFLPQKDGYYDESVDFIFLRHALEHSPFPIFTLIEYNRVLKQGGHMYIEVPAPDCDRKHEFNLNHYSILGQNQLAALFHRTGFRIEKFENIEFTLNVGGSQEPNSDPKEFKEKYYAILVVKDRPLDIK